MKLCLVSTSLQQATGYSKVAYNILRQLTAVKDLELFHYAEHSIDVKFRPSLNLTVKENKEVDFEGLEPFCKQNGVDVVMIYGDIGNIISYLKCWKPPRLWIYLDTVAHGIHPPLLKIIDELAERIYLMNDYWKSVYEFKNARILEHGVDAEVFRPISTNIREKMNIPQDAIVFMNANRNSRRKRLDLTISAFVQFCKRNQHIKTYLVLMTTSFGYYNIANVLFNEIVKHSYNCSKNVISIQTDKQLFTDADMNAFYNMADYGINTSTGEGYGLTVLEHLAVNKPQVLTHLPSYTFVTEKEAVFVKSTGEREYYDKDDYTGSYHEIFSSTDISLAMDKVLNLKPSFQAKSWQQVMQQFVDEFPLSRCNRESVAAHSHEVSLPLLEG